MLDVVMLNVITMNVVMRAECHYAECRGDYSFHLGHHNFLNYKSFFQDRTSLSIQLCLNLEQIARPMFFLESRVSYSALFTFLVGWHTSVVSFPPGNVIFAQLACPYGECTTSRRMNCPKRFHEKIFYLSCIFL